MIPALLGTIASGEIAEAIRRARSAAVAYVLAAILALCGVGFLIGAGFIATAARVGSLYAALIFGFGFLLIGGLVILVHNISAAARKRRLARKRQVDGQALLQTAIMALVPVLVAKGGFKAFLAPLAGFLAYSIYRENTSPKGRRRPRGRKPL